MSDERRSYFRVRDTVCLQVEPVPAHAVKGLVEQLQEPAPDAFYLASEFNLIRQETAVLQRQLSGQPTALRRYLETLDRKLDRVCEVLLVQSVAGGSARRVEVDISADGLGFEWPVAYPEGAHLDLRIVLLSTGGGVRVLGKVRRCRACPDGGHRIGVAFEHLREADREMLVQHGLRRQASMLRSRHEEDA
ncbi:PilZ domain-containing protein [Alkalilimnicola sp. S0819]|uniref:PilZ domain-containing protein n=1 Tax=Alkalilimnicola sp. S0819 TaxID=2613922 RepID=UPI0012627294|nr:PilZ domain-containing protein [Alkalilimnicola sp. S0819]KAB7622627.1 PilZ domain-containing protein [Alkalilimnicola sp. S0819]MPQ17398.1 hypothetical protein [Alkalilimnicola sp. S0819]